MFDRIFDTVSGLPVHILVVHAVVVLVPLMSLVTIAFVLRPRWRPALGWAVLGNAACVVFALVAKESGEKFETRLGVGAAEAVKKHTEKGDVLWLFVVGLLAASAIAWLLVGRTTTADGAGPGGAPVAVALALALLGGISATGWTVLTGDSGSRAVWEDTVKQTKAPG